MRQILVIGSANVDLVMATERLPAPGETRFGIFTRTLGGKGANQAVAAARAGGAVAMIACLGMDEFGRMLRAGLASENIDMTGVFEVEGSSGVAVIVTASSGNNIIVVSSGANASLQAALLEPDLCKGATFVLLQLEIPLETVVRAIGQAHAADAKVILDPAPAIQLPRGILGQVDWLTPNESEARILLGLEDGELDGVRAAYRLRELGARNVIVKLGARGAAILEEGREAIVLPALPTVVVDTTAAGDAFNGAFAAAMAEGRSPVDAARFAIAAASIAVSRHGAQASMASRQEIDALQQGHGSHGPIR